MSKSQRLQACVEFYRDISSDSNRSRETPSLGIMEKVKETIPENIGSLNLKNDY